MHGVRSFVICAGFVFLSSAGPAPQGDERRFQKQLEDSQGDLNIPAGSYVFRGAVEADLAKLGAVTIRANGPVTIRMCGAGPAFRLKGSHRGTAGPSRFEPETWKERMPIVEGFEIFGDHPEADGIELVQTMQPVISRMYIRKVRHAIHLVRRNRNVLISSCHLYDNSGTGVFFDDVDLHQTNIVGCMISHNREGGVVIRDGSVRNVQITGCDIEANMPATRATTDAANILIDQSRVTTDRAVGEISISGCTIQHLGAKHLAPGGANIRILGHARHPVNMVTITGNVIGDASTNLHLDHVMDVTATGNTFFIAQPRDVLVESSTRVTLSGNTFNPRGWGAVGGVVFRNSSYCQLFGSTLTGMSSPDGAILLDQCDASMVSLCTLVDVVHGIRLDGCRNCLVADCIVTDPGADRPPVETLGGDSNRIRDIATTPRIAQPKLVPPFD